MHDSQFAINHLLRSKGFASLEETGPLMSQLAHCVRDDRHFRTLLNACEPHLRGEMYNALAPNLRFTARSLAEYMIELAQDAEHRQLPTIGEDGHFKPFKIPEIQSDPTSDESVATAAAAAAVAKGHLHVVCVVCTREEYASGITQEDALAKIRKLGWRRAFKKAVLEGADPEQVEVCPPCVKARAPRMHAA